MNEMRLNIAEAKDSLENKPLLATSAERFLILDEIIPSLNELSQPRLFSKTLSELLKRVSLPIEKHDIIIGRCVDRELTEEEEIKFLKFIKSPYHPEMRAFLSSGHCTYSWDMVVQKGLVGMRDDVLEKLEKADNEEKKNFYCAIVEIYDAIRDYMLRYADAAEQKGMTDAAENLRKAATERPDSFAVALQLLWIIALIDCAYITENPTLTLGRLDRILYPLYISDIEKGILTRESAAEYITDYYCKHNLIMGRGEHQVGDETNSTTFKRICNFDAPQYLLLAGTDENGKGVANELTELFAECIVPSFKNPVIVVRYFKGMDKIAPKLWNILVNKALDSSAMIFYNDGDVISTLVRCGVPEEDARKYAHFGCNWCSLGDDSSWMLGGPWAAQYFAHLPKEERKSLPSMFLRCNSDHAWPEDFMIVMRNLAEREQDVTIEDFYKLFFERMADFISSFGKSIITDTDYLFSNVFKKIMSR